MHMFVSCPVSTVIGPNDDAQSNRVSLGDGLQSLFLAEPLRTYAFGA